MFSCRINWLLCAACLLTATGHAEEENDWPAYVRRNDPATGTSSTEVLGPLLFTRSDSAVETNGLRPLYLSTVTGGVSAGSFLYPFFTWRREEGHRTFSFFQLVNSRIDADDAAHPDNHFDVWPFYFSREADNPAESYRALIPLGGTIKNRFGKDRISFVLWPLYVHTEKNGRQITHAPWPFLRFIDGEG